MQITYVLLEMLNAVSFVQLRREKISERMKLLQDLVPGCSKVSVLLGGKRSFVFLLTLLQIVFNIFIAFILNSGHRKGGDAGRDHQLCSIPTKTS